MNNANTNLLKVYEEILPPVLYRNKWKQYQKEYGVPYARGTMQNLDSQGKGPKHGLAGGRIYYLKTDYLPWVENALAKAEVA